MPHVSSRQNNRERGVCPFRIQHEWEQAQLVALPDRRVVPPGYDSVDEVTTDFYE